MMSWTDDTVTQTPFPRDTAAMIERTTGCRPGSGGTAFIPSTGPADAVRAMGSIIQFGNHDIAAVCPHTRKSSAVRPSVRGCDSICLIIGAMTSHAMAVGVGPYGETPGQPIWPETSMVEVDIDAASNPAHSISDRNENFAHPNTPIHDSAQEPGETPRPRRTGVLKDLPAGRDDDPVPSILHVCDLSSLRDVALPATSTSTPSSGMSPDAAAWARHAIPRYVAASGIDATEGWTQPSRSAVGGLSGPVKKSIERRAAMATIAGGGRQRHTRTSHFNSMLIPAMLREVKTSPTRLSASAFRTSMSTG